VGYFQFHKNIFLAIKDQIVPKFLILPFVDFFLTILIFFAESFLGYNKLRKKDRFNDCCNKVLFK